MKDGEIIPKERKLDRRYGKERKKSHDKIKIRIT
jgi:hypothetical protein